MNPPKGRKALATSGLAIIRPVVTFTPEWRHIVLGDSLTISCDLGSPAQENETFIWYRDERLMDFHQQNITIESASAVFHGGDYQCRTNTSDVSDPLKLHISLTWVLLQKPPNVYEGSPLTLRCHSAPLYNGTNTTFYKDGQVIQFSVNDSELHIDKVDRSATGIYNCTKIIRFNDPVIRSSEAYVYVRDPVRPVVSFTPNWRNILVGDSVTITCNGGTFTPEQETYYWYRDDKLIDIHQRSFTIQSAHWRNDNGYYQCRTSASGVSDPLMLQVNRGRIILQRPSIVYEGDSLTLRCLSSNEYNAANTTFYKNGQEVKFSASDNELFIARADSGSTGTYKCAQLLQLKASDPNGELEPYRRRLAESSVFVQSKPICGF
ncbi:Fc receptor-like protein 3 isoform X2 [Hyperolius riggenbachi]|uniref:Fc receptor-like protein 3 isoform X2 n=1 Tax=Hyperolius riggenbachi TaxID=752182 RepID=UPI0035A28623